MRTKLQVIQDAQAIHPTLSTARARVLFDGIDRTVRREARVSVVSLTLDTLVAGQEQYALNNDVVRVWTCRYGTTNTTADATSLTATTIDQLENENPDYKKSRGTPAVFYVLGGEIGLFPVPDTSSSGGLPYLTMQVSRAPVMADGDSLPSHIDSIDAWKFGIAKDFSFETGDPRLPYHEKAYYAALERLKRHTGQRAAKGGSQTVIVPGGRGSLWRRV